MAEFVGEINVLAGRLADDGPDGFVLDAGAGVVVRGTARVGSPPADGPARVGIRPERIRARRGPGGEPASVVAKMYIGHLLQLVVRLRNGAELVARGSRDAADAGLDAVVPGDDVSLAWDPDAPLLLGGDDPAATSSRSPA